MIASMYPDFLCYSFDSGFESPGASGVLVFHCLHGLQEGCHICHHHLQETNIAHFISTLFTDFIQGFF